MKNQNRRIERLEKANRGRQGTQGSLADRMRAWRVQELLEWLEDPEYLCRRLPAGLSLLEQREAETIFSAWERQIEREMPEYRDVICDPDAADPWERANQPEREIQDL